MAEPASWTPIRIPIRYYAITSAVLAIVVVILFALYLGMLKKERNRTIDAHSISATTGNNSGSGQAKAATGIPPEPTQVLTRIGTITRISKDEIAFSATMFDEGKGAYVETEMTATTGNNTKYAEIDKTKNTVPVPGQPSLSSNPPSIKRDVLKVGNTIQVISSTNIQGLRRFSVTDVRRLLIK